MDSNGEIDGAPSVLHGNSAKEKALKSRKEYYAKRRESVNIKREIKDRRQADQIPNQKYAIRNHCLECMGWEADPKLCTAKNCWLYPYRTGKLELPK